MSSLAGVVGPLSWGPLEGEEGLAVALLLSLAILSWLLSRYAGSLHRRMDRITAALFDPPTVGLGSASETVSAAPSTDAPTAVLFLDGYDPVGVEALLRLGLRFPGAFPQLILASARPFDAGGEDGRAEGRTLKSAVEHALRRYSPLARLLEMRVVEVRVALGADEVGPKIDLARTLSREYTRPVFFCPRLHLEPERWYHRFLQPGGVDQVARRLERIGLVAADLVIPATVRAETVGRAWGLARPART